MKQMIEQKRETVVRTMGLGLVVSGVVLGLCGGAMAQDRPAVREAVPAAEARSAYVTVTREGAPLRSGAASVWYSVASLKAGTILRVDGEEDGWLRVAFPQDVPAVVKPTEGDLDRDRSVVRLRRASALWALDVTKPQIENAYKQIFAASPIPAGTELRYLGPVNDNTGSVAGFKVEPPRGALGFVLPSDVRSATAEEIASVTPRQESVETEEPQEQGAGEGTGAVTDGAADGASGGESGGVSGETAGTADGASDGAPVEAEEGSVESEGEARSPEEAALARLAELDAAYQRVLEQPLMQAEFVDLIAEYEALKQSVPAESAMAEAIASSADLRIELLQIRAQLQSARRELENLETEQATAAADLERFVQEAGRAREYTAVGRLLPSTIYSGAELPRMYRLVSLEGNAMRTVAYVLPVEGLGLEGMVGSIVGVRGDSEVGRSERVQIIRPATADVLRAGE